MKTKAIALGSIAGAILAPGAQAADLPTKGYAPAPAMASWAGFYIGGHIGGASTEAKVWDDDYGKTKFVGGGQLGVNFQSGSFVYGIEIDGSALAGDSGKIQDGDLAYGAGMSWLATARGRMGIAFGSAGDWLAYATAGVAFTKVKTWDVDCCLDGPVNVSGSKTLTGWVVGAGIEKMVARNWTVGAEVLFADFGANSVSAGKSTNVVNSSVLLGRFKVNYKF